MIETLKLFLIRHAPVKKFDGYIPKNNPNAIINLDHFKSLASRLPFDSTCYVSHLKRAVQTAKALSKYVNFRNDLGLFSLAKVAIIGGSGIASLHVICNTPFL